MDYHDATKFSVSNFIYGDKWLDLTSLPCLFSLAKRVLTVARRASSSREASRSAEDITSFDIFDCVFAVVHPRVIRLLAGLQRLFLPMREAMVLQQLRYHAQRVRVVLDRQLCRDDGELREVGGATLGNDLQGRDAEFFFSHMNWWKS
ncbi:hypothetical protein ACMD2_04212 [Ananas comosus]|uniref:Uncharacterized protein n=1 Tax=Ananas comosus TaxID=4615 RepID=A0A199VRX8_ANACO|nr:hypothetical protein ACMD2_04212 [Ananas comosus]